MIFTPAHRVQGHAFAIGLSVLHQYFDEYAMPTPYARQSLERGAAHMGFDNDRHAVKKLLDALYEMVDDLVKAIPPELEEPDHKRRRALGEVEVRIDGKLVAGTEIVR